MFPFFSAAYSSTPLSLNLKILLTLSWEFKSNTHQAAAWHAIPVSIADTKTTPYTKSVNQKHSSLFLFFCKVQYVLFCSDQQYFRIPDNIHCTNAKYQRVYMASFKLNIALWRYNHFFGILRRIPHKIINACPVATSNRSITHCANGWRISNISSVKNPHAIEHPRQILPCRLNGRSL